MSNVSGGWPTAWRLLTEDADETQIAPLISRPRRKSAPRNVLITNCTFLASCHLLPGLHVALNASHFLLFIQVVVLCSATAFSGPFRNEMNGPLAPPCLLNSATRLGHQNVQNVQIRKVNSRMLKPSIVTSVTLDLPARQPMQIRPPVIDGRPISRIRRSAAQDGPFIPAADGADVASVTSFSTWAPS